MIKLAFAGKMQAGKTSAASYCDDIHGFPVLSFADKLKFDLIDMGIDIERVFVTKDKTVRKLMQYYGQAHREQDPLHWVNKTLNAAADIENMELPGVCIDDLRYINEAEELKKEGFTLVRIIREGHETLDEHASETELDNYPDFDYTVSVKDGDLLTLYAEIDKIVEKLED